MSHAQWDQFLRQAPHCSFQQAWEYGAAIAQGRLVVNRFVAIDQGEPVAIGQIISRRLPGLVKFTLLLNGPLWLKKIDHGKKIQILAALRQRFPLKYFSLFAFSPQADSAGRISEQNIYENMGVRQIITGGSTVYIDLTLSEDQLWQNLYGKNRTDIRKAKKADFKVTYGDHNHIQTDWLLEREQKQQKEKKYQGLPVELVKNYGQFSRAGRQNVYTAFAVKKGDDTPLSGVLFLGHGRSATYHIGWNGRRGRKCRALNLLLWNMILKLKKAGIETIDLGGINTEKGADIARYKLSFGGNIINQSGTFM